MRCSAPPTFLRAVKLAVDRDPTPGRFLLTGSANLLTMCTVTESLAGRAAYLELLPLSWSEVVRAPRPTTLDDAFAAASAPEFLDGLLPAPAGAGEAARERALVGRMPVVYDDSMPTTAAPGTRVTGSRSSSATCASSPRSRT